MSVQLAAEIKTLFLLIFCISTAASLIVDASVSSMKGSLKFGNCKTGYAMSVDLSLSTACLISSEAENFSACVSFKVSN